MTNEIKEILDILEGRKKNVFTSTKKNNSPFNDEDYIAYMVLDYITNLQEENKHLKWERDSYYDDIICYIRNTMHVSDKKARKTFDKVSMEWSSSTIYLTLCELDKDLRGDE